MNNHSDRKENIKGIEISKIPNINLNDNSPAWKFLLPIIISIFSLLIAAWSVCFFCQFVLEVYVLFYSKFQIAV